VREDIVDRLRMRDHELVVTGFARENIALDVVRVTTPAEQQRTVLERVAAAPGSGIVYCRTRRSAEEYSYALAASGRPTAVYHAGLSRRRRAAAHEAFLAGEIEVVVATSAFGMGIDKPDIRFVVHAQVPESPDTYYQEVGRGGRDGEPATATLVYRDEDLALGKFFSGGVPAPEDVAAALKADRRAVAKGATGEARVKEVSERTGFGPRKTGRILNLVDEVRNAGGPAGAGKRMTAAVVERADAYRRLQGSRVDMMRGYAETDRCRSAYLLAYFGEPAGELCGHCDNCRAGVAGEETADHDVFGLQTRVVHDEFGDGVVTDVEEDRITVLFDEVGYRTLSLRVVEEQALLAPAG
jgi:ATP-dependent DNA helicase RecQ